MLQVLYVGGDIERLNPEEEQWELVKELRVPKIQSGYMDPEYIIRGTSTNKMMYTTSEWWP
ncbi:hypothetical protein C5167_003334 [Papaver somniferum]|uniref:Uncharacterized protein n=1 Tax=Papaver somniferum TaxID=3469 RepID=A0A4Y7L0I4_PAPSO|nr:hypothetical protein C5167_003334 [Papaver somniferum]